MKKLFQSFLVIFIAAICTPFTMRADDNNGSGDDGTIIELPLLKKPLPNPPDHPIDPDKGHRAPGQLVFGYISQTEGVQIGIDKAEIVAYEIWDAEGEMLIASFVDESAFVTTIFTVPEDIYLLKIITIDYQYIGELATY